MKSFLLKSAVFLTCIFVLTKLIGTYDNKDKYSTTNGDAAKTLKMIEFDSLDVLFIGNSYCYSSVAIPLFDSLNKRTFNLGIATSGLAFYELLWDVYSKTVKKTPDTVCVLLSPITFSGQADNWAEYPIHRYLANDLSNENITIRFNCWGSYPNLLFNSCRKGIVNLFSFNTPIPKAANFSYISINKGFMIDSSINNLEIEKSTEHFYLPLKKDHYPTNSTNEILDLAKKIESEGSTVVFFETPVNKLNNYFTEAYLNAYKQTVNDVTLQYPVIRKPTNFSATDFRNIDHTNTQGAFKYTAYLINKLYTDTLKHEK